MKLYRPDAEIRDLQHAPDLPEVVRGVEAIRRMLETWAEIYDEWGVEVSEYIDADPWVIGDTRWYGKGRGSDLRVDLRGAEAYELEGGKILRGIVGCPDVPAALKAAGLTDR
jgi:hypothetical protein